jgi:hypothetical protein
MIMEKVLDWRRPRSLGARVTVRRAESAQLSGHAVRCLAEDQCRQEEPVQLAETQR